MQFQYPKICFSLVGNLQPRTKDILTRRFGLHGGEPETLDAIGKNHSLTRERVRQIAEDGMSRVRETARQPKYEAMLAPVFQRVERALEEAGHVKREDLLIELLRARDAINHIIFLLTIGDQFAKYRETEDLRPFWTCRQEVHEKVPALVKALVGHFEKRQAPSPQEEIRPAYRDTIVKEHGMDETVPDLVSLLEISKHIVQGYDGKWGLKWWAQVNPRGMRDKAYLVLKNAGSPLHFLDVAGRIRELQRSFPQGKEKQVLPQTVHNELIKDSRFVLVGRGIYGLAEWGYKPGTVKDVIVDLLKEHGSPLCKEDILKKTLERRKVKETTVFLNLQDRGTFVKTEDGSYFVVKA